jgi:hypothetical protein
MINNNLFEHFTAENEKEKEKKIENGNYNIATGFFGGLTIILTSFSLAYNRDKTKWKILLMLVAIIVLILNFTIKNDLAKNVGNDYIFNITFLVINIICAIIISFIF